MYKLGAKPSKFSAGHFARMNVLSHHLDILGTPPVNSTDWSAAVIKTTGMNWGMMGNGNAPDNPPDVPDGAGDCMIADCGHRVMLMSANVLGSTNIIVPSADTCLSFYEDESGFVPGNDSTDNGTDESDLAAYLANNLFDGQKLIAHASVRIRITDHIKWTVQKFGGCRFCIQLPQSAVDQFDAGKPWDIVANDGGILGGHDILGTHYIGDQFYVVTWGRLIPASLAFLRRYMFEAHAEVWSTWLNAQNKTVMGDDLSALTSALIHVHGNN